jgi:hypothetical protein
MKRSFKPIKPLLALIPFSILLSSCSRDFPAAQRVAKMTVALEQASSSMADDVYNSCITRTRYISLLSTSNTSEPFSLREEQEKLCAEVNKPTAANVKKANAVLVNYLKSIGRLASGDTVSFDQNLTALGESLKGLSIPTQEGTTFSLNASNVNAGISISKFLLNATTGEFRRRHLKQAIVCTDKDIQAYIGSSQNLAFNKSQIGGLIGIAQAYIDGVLKAEEEQIKTFFSDYVAVLSKSPENLAEGRATDYLQIEEHYNKAIDSLKSRREAAESYIAELKNIAAMHEELKNEFQGKQKAPLSEAQFQKYCQDLYQEKSQEKVATKEQESVTYDKEEIKRIEAIVAKYAPTLESLSQKLNKGSN